MTSVDDKGFVSKGDNLSEARLPDTHINGDGLVRWSDPEPLFKAKDEAVLEMGNDGDDDGRSASDQEVGDMLDSGHGFLIRDAKPVTPRTHRPTCEICGRPIPAPGEDPDWLCQYGDENKPVSLDCNCAWCLAYQDYMAGKYKPNGGRPRKRCGDEGCDTEAAKRRQANKRARDKGEELPWPDINDAPAGPFTVEMVEAALEAIYAPKSDYDTR